MFKQLRTISRCRPAFSIIEIMAVLLIVSLAMIGVANLAVQSIQAQTINRGSIIAYQLAQEGIEIVRQIRDTNWMQGNNWKDGLDSGSYCVDYLSPVLRVASSLNDCPLYFTDDNWYYSPALAASNSKRSNFKRLVSIDAATSSASVRATITWNDRNNVFTYEVETELYDWK